MFNNLKREKASDHLQQNDYVKNHTGVKENEIKHTCNTSTVWPWNSLPAIDYEVFNVQCIRSDFIFTIS